MKEREEVKHARNKEDLNQTLVWTTVCVCLFRVRSSSGQCCACMCAVQQCFLHPVLRVTEMALPRQHSRKKKPFHGGFTPRFHEMQSRDLELEDPVAEFCGFAPSPSRKSFSARSYVSSFSCPNVLVFTVRCPSCWLVRRVGCKFLGKFDISWC